MPRGIPVQGIGRPLVVDGRAVTSPTTSRNGWQSPVEPIDLPAALSAALADAWAIDAALEHASVASFARFVLELMRLGAPLDLVAGANAAMADEIEHARLSYGLASRYAGNALGPGPLPLDGVALSHSLVECALGTLVEGCIGETVASVVASHMLAHAIDPEVRRVLTIILRDEAEHARLAYRFVAWAIRQDTSIAPSLAAALPAAIAAARATSRQVTHVPDEAAWLAHGRLSAQAMRRAIDEAIDEVVSPCVDELLRPRLS